MARTTTGTPRQAPPPSRGSLWHNERFRNALYQALALACLIALAAFLISNALTNLSERSIRTGFDFLEREAGFRIGESLIPYSAQSSYGRAYVVGVLNTLRVAVIGIAMATLIGILLGIARLSPNWLIVQLATAYVETVRNIPLLLQLFFWYAVVTGILPPVRQARHPAAGRLPQQERSHVSRPRARPHLSLRHGRASHRRRPGLAAGLPRQTPPTTHRTAARGLPSGFGLHHRPAPADLAGGRRADWSGRPDLNALLRFKAAIASRRNFWRFSLG